MSMEYFLDFKPLIRSSYCQTIIGTTFNFDRGLPSKTHYIRLKDDDMVAAEISTPKGWKDGDPMVFMVHGLCGSHKSHYMTRIARRFYKIGYQAIRINLRNCGSGRGLAKNIYHSGSSDDVKEVIEDLTRHFPKSPKALVGFSLGGNIVLKLAGEFADNGHDHLKGVVAVGAPIDLLSSARLFMQPNNQIYANYFLRLLMNDVNFIHSHFSDLPPHNLPEEISLHDFDELYVAPRANYTSALEYYYKCSSKKVIKNVIVPTKVLLALDDPIISPHSLNDVELPDNIEVYKTQHGGHIGFMGQNIFKEFRWMDNQVVNWVEDYFKKPKGRRKKSTN